MRTAALHPRQHPRPSGIPAAIRCAVPRTHRWAGAATPTQRNTTQALERARRASDVINISNSTSKNNPSWLLAEPERPPWPAPTPAHDTAADSAAREGSGSRSARLGRLGRLATVLRQGLLTWLAATPRWLGDRPCLLYAKE